MRDGIREVLADSMRLSLKRSEKIERYHEIGGVLEFAIFEDVGPDVNDHRNAIKESIELSNQRHCLWLEQRLGNSDKFAPRWINQAELTQLPFERISIATFHGDWFDCRHRRLVFRGTWHGIDGTVLSNPFITDLDQAQFKGEGHEIPELWTHGEFAYAFTSPPYRLRASPQEIENLYLEICDLILPTGQDGRIYSWNNQRLLNVSNYFEAGADWWGCFAITIFDPKRSQLSAIIGSTTD